MGRVRITGAGAEAFLQRLQTNDVTQIPPGGIRYALILDDQGLTQDDVLVYREPDGDGFFMVVNASNTEHDLGIMHALARSVPNTRVVDQTEELVFGRFDATAQQEMFRLKRDLLHIRRVLGPERDVLNLLMRRDTPIYSDEMVRYFQDIYDHLLRAQDSIDTFRDLLSSALDSYLSVLSNRMNKVMKKMTSWGAILIAATLISSIYGMNFRHMPELGWSFGYPAAIASMLVVTGCLYLWFRHRDWL